jgi:hypothetical protein
MTYSERQASIIRRFILGSENPLLLLGSNGNCAISSMPTGLSGVVGVRASGRES